MPENSRQFVHADHLIHNDSEKFYSEIVDFVPKEAALVHVPPVVTDVPTQDNVPSNTPEVVHEENVEIDLYNTKVEQSTSSPDAPVRRSSRIIKPTDGKLYNFICCAGLLKT